jgi:hypothetical protein
VNKSIRPVLALAGAAALTTAGLALASGPAQAVEKRPAVVRYQHCVVDVSGQAATACFDSFTEAISQATGGRVTDAPTDPWAAATDAGLDATLNAAAERSSLIGTGADTVISIEYLDRNFDGGTQIWSAGGGCNDTLNNVDHEAGDVTWVVNQISSWRSYANCWVKHYENPNFGGDSIGYLPTRSYIGDAMDDRTSSIRWS